MILNVYPPTDHLSTIMNAKGTTLCGVWEDLGVQTSTNQYILRLFLVYTVGCRFWDPKKIYFRLFFYLFCNKQ